MAKVVSYIDNIEMICDLDCFEVRKKDKSYGSSWKKRGGVGAFMMLARKWDRLEAMMTDPDKHLKYDVLDAVGDGTDGTPLAEIRDLRRYLLLVEAEILHNSEWHKETVSQKVRGTLIATPEDGGQHARQKEDQN